jgi:hypothetical protein
MRGSENRFGISQPLVRLLHEPLSGGSIQSAPGEHDLVSVDLLDKEGLDLAALLQPLWVVDVDREIERTLPLGDCNIFAKVAD